MKFQSFLTVLGDALSALLDQISTPPTDETARYEWRERLLGSLEKEFGKQDLLMIVKVLESLQDEYLIRESSIGAEVLPLHPLAGNELWSDLEQCLGRMDQKEARFRDEQCVLFTFLAAIAFGFRSGRRELASDLLQRMKPFLVAAFEGEAPARDYGGRHWTSLLVELPPSEEQNEAIARTRSDYLTVARFNPMVATRRWSQWWALWPIRSRARIAGGIVESRTPAESEEDLRRVGELAQALEPLTPKGPVVVCPFGGSELPEHFAMATTGDAEASVRTATWALLEGLAQLDPDAESTHRLRSPVIEAAQRYAAVSTHPSLAESKGQLLFTHLEGIDLSARVVEKVMGVEPSRNPPVKPGRNAGPIVKVAAAVLAVILGIFGISKLFDGNSNPDGASPIALSMQARLVDGVGSIPYHLQMALGDSEDEAPEEGWALVRDLGAASPSPDGSGYEGVESVAEEAHVWVRLVPKNNLLATVVSAPYEGQPKVAQIIGQKGHASLAGIVPVGLDLNSETARIVLSVVSDSSEADSSEADRRERGRRRGRKKETTPAGLYAQYRTMVIRFDHAMKKQSGSAEALRPGIAERYKDVLQDIQAEIELRQESQSTFNARLEAVSNCVRFDGAQALGVMADDSFGEIPELSPLDAASLDSDPSYSLWLQALVRLRADLDRRAEFTDKLSKLREAPAALVQVLKLGQSDPLMGVIILEIQMLLATRVQTELSFSARFDDVSDEPALSVWKGGLDSGTAIPVFDFHPIVESKKIIIHEH